MTLISKVTRPLLFIRKKRYTFFGQKKRSKDGRYSRWLDKKCLPYKDYYFKIDLFEWFYIMIIVSFSEKLVQAWLITKMCKPCSWNRVRNMQKKNPTQTAKERPTLYTVIVFNKIFHSHLLCSKELLGSQFFFVWVCISFLINWAVRVLVLIEKV